MASSCDLSVSRFHSRKPRAARINRSRSASVTPRCPPASAAPPLHEITSRINRLTSGSSAASGTTTPSPFSG